MHDSPQKCQMQVFKTTDLYGLNPKSYNTEVNKPHQATYAFGVHGGIDFVANTMCLGVDRYITSPKNKGELPSRALISLGIQNMFNAMSCQKL